MRLHGKNHKPDNTHSWISSRARSTRLNGMTELFYKSNETPFVIPASAPESITVRLHGKNHKPDNTQSWIPSRARSTRLDGMTELFYKSNDTPFVIPASAPESITVRCTVKTINLTTPRAGFRLALVVLA